MIRVSMSAAVFFGWVVGAYLVGWFTHLMFRRYHR